MKIQGLKFLKELTLSFRLFHKHSQRWQKEKHCIKYKTDILTWTGPNSNKEKISESYKICQSEKWVWERRLGSNHGGRWLSTGRVWTYPVNSGKPLNWVIDMTEAVLWGQVLLRSREQNRRGCKTSLRARQEEREEEMDGKTFKKQHNLLTSTKM